MSPLLAPLLAQLISLNLGDRTEARYVNLYGSKRYEGSTAPVVGLGIAARRTRFVLSYGPAFTLAPLERAPRSLYVFHQVATSLSYSWRRTTLSFGTTLGIGSLDLRLVGVQGLQPPTGAAGPTTDTPTTGTPTTGMPTTGTPTTGTPTTGTPTPPGGVTNVPGGAITQQSFEGQKVRFYTTNTTLGVQERLTRDLSIGVTAGSARAGGLDEDSRRFYPPLYGWSLGGNTGYGYALSKQDRFAGALSLLKTWSSNDNQAATLNSTVGWTHLFDPRTAGSLAVGFNVTRFSQSNGLAGFSVFPTFTLGATHGRALGRGGISFSTSVYSSPALDPLRALVDPRVGAAGTVGYTRKKLFMMATGSVAFSVAPSGNNAGAVNAAQAEARTGYLLAALTAVDAGARITRQTYGGQNVVPTSWAAFVGVTFGYSAILAGRPR